MTGNRTSVLHSNADDDGGATGLSPRELRKQQRIALSREQILDTAEELFAEYGYHETGLKDLAARCEFSVGSIYAPRRSYCGMCGLRHWRQSGARRSRCLRTTASLRSPKCRWSTCIDTPLGAP